MKAFLVLLLGTALLPFCSGQPGSSGQAAAAAAPAAPSVLFIVVDDLNDWVGCLGGHPQAKTPNLDRLARRGVIFSNAHCAAPLCNPSRAAVFSGRHPFETGVYANDGKNIREIMSEELLIPAQFKRAGYRTFGTGKLLHQKSTGLFDEDFFPEQRWSPFQADDVDYTREELPSKGTDNPRHLVTLGARQIILPLNRMPSDRAAGSRKGESFDWGPLDVTDSDMGDGLITDWAVARLNRKDPTPFFLAVGFYRPHIPLYAPKKYFDLYAHEDVRLPEVKADDLDDLSPAGKKWALEAVTAGSHATVVKYGQWKAAVTAYLACVSFIDAQVGRLLDALDSSPFADNTMIVLWGDHGWHLGEKQHWGKWTGWQRSTHVPLLVIPPRSFQSGRYQGGSACSEPVSLLDLYPTLLDICGLPAGKDLAGQSLAPLISDPSRQSGRVVVTTFDLGNYSLTDSRWHYIRYQDGSEELYDSVKDPQEWNNLASHPEYRVRLQKMRGIVPK